MVTSSSRVDDTPEERVGRTVGKLDQKALSERLKRSTA